jgi:hypothetical protein
MVLGVLPGMLDMQDMPDMLDGAVEEAVVLEKARVIDVPT